MKHLLLFTVLLSLNVQAQSQEKQACRFDLIGPATLPDSILEKEPMTLKECRTRIQTLLKMNTDSYNKALLRFGSDPKWTVIELKDSKED